MSNNQDLSDILYCDEKISSTSPKQTPKKTYPRVPKKKQIVYKSFRYWGTDGSATNVSLTKLY